MEEISSMTRQNAEHSLDAARLVGEAGTAVANANQMLGEMVTSMANIKESSRKVSNIIKTINQIALDQHPGAQCRRRTGPRRSRRHGLRRRRR